MNWYQLLTKWISEQGYQEFTVDPCIYHHKTNNNALYFHVDDLLVASNSTTFQESYLDNSKGSRCHAPDTLLGMKIEILDNCILQSQPKHILHGLEELNLSTANLQQLHCHRIYSFWRLPTLNTKNSKDLT